MTYPDSSAPLRTALIGLGRIGFQVHVPAIAAHPGFRLAGVVDPLAERGAEATALWGAPAFTSVGAMLAAVRPALVVVASPTGFHREHVCQAFAAGAHVFCDKPVALSVGEFDEMASAGRAAGKSFVAFQPNRLRGEMAALGEILAQGRLGRIHFFKRANSSFVRRNDWQAFRAHGGGLLNNYAAHHLDEMLALMGDAPVRSVYCQTRQVVTAGDAEDFVKIVLTYETGLVADFDITQASAQPVPPWQVFGSQGSATWDAGQRQWHITRFDPAAVPPREAQGGLAAANRLYGGETLPWEMETVPAGPELERNYYDALWRHLVRGEPSPVSTDSMRALLVLIERCRRSADTGQVT